MDLSCLSSPIVSYCHGCSFTKTSISLGKASKIKSKISVTMIHGENDEVVPVIFSKRVLSLFPFAKKKLIMIKSGDHSLSNKGPIKRIIKELDIIVKDVI